MSRRYFRSYHSSFLSSILYTPFVISAWSDWSICELDDGDTCGNGVIYRNRTVCAGDDCGSQVLSCYVHCDGKKYLRQWSISPVYFSSNFTTLLQGGLHPSYLRGRQCYFTYFYRFYRDFMILRTLSNSHFYSDSCIWLTLPIIALFNK